MILFATGCLDLFVMESNIEVITAGEGVYARGFKPGKYRGSGKSTGHIEVDWIKKDREYEIRQMGQHGQDEQKAMRFRLKKLKGKYYLLQSKEEQEQAYQYFIIRVEEGVVNFPDIKEESKEKAAALKKKYGLTEDEDGRVTASPRKILAFLKAVIKQKCLKPGHAIQLFK